MIAAGENIILVGFMGSGKTTVGRQLAKKSGRKFLDLDQFIEEQEGKSITEIFESIGEKGFRELETQAIQKLESNANLVISTGGGLPCFNDNMSRLNDLGFTIFLDVPIKMIASRLAEATAKRPLLADKSASEILDFISLKMQERRPFYQQAKMTYANINSPAELFELLSF